MEKKYENKIIKKCDICGKTFLLKSYSDKREICKGCYERITELEMEE